MRQLAAALFSRACSRGTPLPLTANSAASKLACFESGSKLPHSKALRASSLRLIRWPGFVAENCSAGLAVQALRFLHSFLDKINFEKPQGQKRALRYT